MKKLAILFGGHSSEYSVSLESAYSVLSHINKEKYDLYMIGITKEGKWYHFDRDIEQIRDDTWWQIHYILSLFHPNLHNMHLLK